VIYDLCIKFGIIMECLSVIRTRSSKFECLKVERRFRLSIRSFDDVRCDLRSRAGSCYILGLVGVIGWGPAGLGCDSEWFQTIFPCFAIAGAGVLFCPSRT